MELDEFIKAINRNNNYIILKITDDTIFFNLISESRVRKILTVNFGVKTIIEKYLTHKVPSEAEVEYAINFIEDELMSNNEYINFNNQDLYIINKWINNSIDSLIDDKTFSREMIEEIFTRYALVSMGRSPVYDDIDMDNESMQAY